MILFFIAILIQDSTRPEMGDMNIFKRGDRSELLIMLGFIELGFEVYGFIQLL